MGKYVDGFVIPVAKNKIADYRKIAKLAGKVWMDYGALEYLECVGDDLDVPMGLPFPKAVKARPGETVLFSFIVYKSRSHRDRVNRKVMADPRMKFDPAKMPFDMKRMQFGGFKAIVEG